MRTEVVDLRGPLRITGDHQPRVRVTCAPHGIRHPSCIDPRAPPREPLREGGVVDAARSPHPSRRRHVADRDLQRFDRTELSDERAGNTVTGLGEHVHRHARERIHPAVAVHVRTRAEQ
ncbi:hypothetical protein [Microbacterium maritypicum]